MLDDESTEQFGRLLPGISPEKSRRANQPALADLHFLQAELTAVSGQPEHIAIFRPVCHRFLPVHQTIQRLYPVPQQSRRLETHLFGSLLHVLAHLVEQPVVPAFEKKADALHDFTIGTGRHIALARSDAAANVVIEARAILADVARQDAMAGFQRENGTQSFQSMKNVAGQIRPVIAGPMPAVIADPESLEDARVESRSWSRGYRDNPDHRAAGYCNAADAF